jgi:hypothetical protein
VGDHHPTGLLCMAQATQAAGHAAARRALPPAHNQQHRSALCCWQWLLVVLRASAHPVQVKQTITSPDCQALPKTSAQIMLAVYCKLCKLNLYTLTVQPLHYGKPCVAESPGTCSSSAHVCPTEMIFRVHWLACACGNSRGQGGLPLHAAQ